MKFIKKLQTEAMIHNKLKELSQKLSQNEQEQDEIYNIYYDTYTSFCATYRCFFSFDKLEVLLEQIFNESLENMNIYDVVVQRLLINMYLIFPTGVLGNSELEEFINELETTPKRMRQCKKRIKVNMNDEEILKIIKIHKELWYLFLKKVTCDEETTKIILKEEAELTKKENKLIEEQLYNLKLPRKYIKEISTELYKQLPRKKIEDKKEEPKINTTMYKPTYNETTPTSKKTLSIKPILKKEYGVILDECNNIKEVKRSLNIEEQLIVINLLEQLELTNKQLVDFLIKVEEQNLKVGKSYTYARDIVIYQDSNIEEENHLNQVEEINYYINIIESNEYTEEEKLDAIELFENIINEFYKENPNRRNKIKLKCMQNKNK